MYFWNEGFSFFWDLFNGHQLAKVFITSLTILLGLWVTFFHIICYNTWILSCVIILNLIKLICILASQILDIKLGLARIILIRIHAYLWPCIHWDVSTLALVVFNCHGISARSFPSHYFVIISYNWPIEAHLFLGDNPFQITWLFHLCDQFRATGAFLHIAVDLLLPRDWW